MTTHRLPSGGRVDRARPLPFTFDGRAYTGLAGDTLASALLANGVHLVGRSFKYHRPRGIIAAGSEEPNALVTVSRDGARRTPNLRATEVELYDGLAAVSQNRTPSLGFDLGAVNDLIWPLLPAGFYYKTFKWPRGAWHKLYEPLIRRAAGLGRAPQQADTDRYAQRFAHCDVLVVGGGRSGLAAAVAAAKSGARVMLCDEQAELGGSLLGQPDGAWREQVRTLAGLPGVTLLPRTVAFGYFAHNMIGLVERVTDHLPDPDPRLPRERLWQVRAKEVVLATGAIERPLVFPGNDRPGVMLAGAARIYVERYGVRLGRRAVVATADDAAYRAALALHHAGIGIAAIADLRAAPSGDDVAAALAAGLRIVAGTTIAGTTGRLRVNGVRLSGGGETIACDLVLLSAGFTPSIHLFSQARGKLRHDAARGMFLPDTSVERVTCVGSCSGQCSASNAPAVAAPPHGRAFVDFQNDVTAKDLLLAVREGFQSIEHVKRYTTSGMATDQGKLSNMNALGIVAGELGRTVPQVGLTTFRMPYTPVSFGALAGCSRGELFDPVRVTPIHQWAVEQGALFEDVGNWKRARAFPRGGEDLPAAVARECRAVREAVGVFDASTLGKIEVAGPDAATFMNRMYVNAWSKLAPGRCRYGVMLREDGFVLDDGVVGRLASDRFHVTTTTGGAAGVLAKMEDFRQTEWPDLDVWLTSITEQWAVIAVQGPRAREVLAGVAPGVDLSAVALPHMSVVEATVCNLPARLFRVSFSGELGFEINVPAGHGRAAWEAVMHAGAPYGITPYGTEAMHVLRAEKGFIIVGQETDGTATPDDVGLGWAIGRAKGDFVGKRALRLPAMQARGRKQLVGLLTDDPAMVLEEGAQLVTGQERVSLGHVTSSYASANLGRSIALAMLADGRARRGETLSVPMPGGAAIPVKVASPVFYDPEGARLDA